MHRLIPRESEEQAAFFDGVAWTYKSRADFQHLLLFATFNGEIWRSYGKVARAGLVRGVSDILYLQPRGVFAYFACELKRIDRRGEKDGGLTPAESGWLSAARDSGAFICIAYGADEALVYFSQYMALSADRHSGT